MKNKKGFTLIELLAVIVILAVIALIATPIILNMIEDAKKSSAKDSAYGYIKAIEYETSLADLKGPKYKDKEDYTYNEIKVNIKGEAPTGGKYSLKNGVVTSGVFCINGYTVNYENSIVTVGDKGCTGEDLKYEGKVVLSETKGDYTYPESGTFEITENLSGGELSCTTSDSAVATCSIEGNIVTVKPGTKEDSATITIISTSTEKYKEAQAAYVVKTAKGLLTIDAYDYTVTYDGKEHSIILEVEDATIKYGTEEGKYTSTENPTYTNVGTYTVYYEITKEGYNTITGSKTVTINKAEGSVTAPTAKTLTYNGSSQTLINAGSSNTGTIQYKLNDGTYSANLPKATNAGTYTVYYKVVGDENHNDVDEQSITITINKKAGSVTLSSTSGEIYTGKSTTFTASNATGNLSCSSSSKSIATCSISGTTITVNGVAAGSATITVNVAKSTNYKATSKTYSIKINNKLFADGTTIYYNPVAGTKCSSSQAVSTTGTKTGCMKFYAFNDSQTSSTVNIILDHNTTAQVKYNSTGTNTEMKEVQDELDKLVSESKWVITPRLITADEVAQITGAKSALQWTSDKKYANTPVIGTSISMFYLDGAKGTDTIWQTKVVNSQGASSYEWLYDYTNGCISYGCNIEDSTVSGYWTSSPMTNLTKYTWGVHRMGTLDHAPVDYVYYGVRPVITVSKSLIS